MVKADQSCCKLLFEYLPNNYRVEATYVDGVVVRYSISSR